MAKADQVGEDANCINNMASQTNAGGFYDETTMKYFPADLTT